MFLSIIIPVYNSEKTLARLLDSVLKQEISNYEVIAVNDGSMDDSINILDSYKNKFKNLKIIKQENLGQAQARNNGLSEAVGQWVLFLDSDDELTDQALSQMLKDTRNTKLVVGGIKKIFRGHIEQELRACFENSKSNQEMITKYLLDNREMDVGLWNKLFLKKVINQNTISFKNTNYFEDSFFVFEYLLAIEYYEIAYVHQVVYTLFKREGSTTGQFDKGLKEKAKSYLNNVERKLEKFEMKKAQKRDLMSGLAIRLKIFELHQCFKFDNNLSAKQASRSLRQLKVNVGVLKKLNMKYLIAYISILLAPKIYIKAYLKRKK